MKGRLAWLLVALSIGACVDPPADPFDSAEGGVTSSTAPTGDSTVGAETRATSTAGEGSGVDTGTDTGADAETGIKLDVSGMPDAPAGSGCHNVDVLFVIDDSGSMATFQQNLVDSFSGFAEALQTQLAGVSSYHVGVVTSDAYPFNAAGCQLAGALVTQTGGPDSSGMVCGPFAAGATYMTEVEPDLASAFACTAQVGDGGSADERPMESLLAAVDDPLNGMGGCNEGFLRDDALLVVVIITDTDDNMGSPGTPPTWFDSMIVAKAVETNVAILTIAGMDPPNLCPPGTEQKTPPRLYEFASMFTHTFAGDICAADYGPMLADAIAVIDDACEDFVPAG